MYIHAYIEIFIFYISFVYTYIFISQLFYFYTVHNLLNIVNFQNNLALSTDDEILKQNLRETGNSTKKYGRI